MRKIVSFLFVSCISISATLAASWIDLTSDYITNPNYANDSNAGWTMQASAGSTNCAYGAQEFWNGVWRFYQTISVPNGHYRLTVNGYHRPAAHSNDAVENYESTEITSFLFANETSVPLKSVYTESLTSNYNGGCWSYGSGRNRLWYPNNMESASYCFQQGMYVNQMEFDVTDGSLTFGIENQTYVSSNWSIFTGWKLEFYGDITKVTSITLSESSKKMIVGEKARLTATIMPEDATLRKVTWASSNESVVSVDNEGNITAMKAGNATISATATDGSEKKGTCSVTVTTNAAGLSKLIINEIQSSNVDQTLDPSWNYGGWAELYNPDETAVSLTGCWVSDDGENLKKVHISQPMAIPAKGYMNLWFGHHDKYCLTQMDMKLDMDGDTLFISDSQGKLLISQAYPEGISRCSYARQSLDSDVWGWTSNPTPEAANKGSFCATRLEAPVVDHDSQVFGTSLTVCVNIPAGATLKYTTDGSAPSATHGLTSFDGLFYPSKTTTYRFRLIRSGYLPSPVVTRTYIYQDKDFTLPVFSVVSDDANLWGDDYGILVRGNGNGRPGNGQSSPCNWNMDWERPVNFEYINTEGEMVVNQETAMERCGGWSRAWAPYAFKIKANKRYELQSYLPYEFFASKPYLKHKTLQMRNGGNDTDCRIKDPALQEIVFRSGIDVDCQGYQPAMHYINGRYAGVINVREPNNKHYVYAHYGLDEDEIDQFEMSPDSGYVQKCGTYESMQRWYDLSQSCADDDVYEQIRQMVDIDEYCNYMAIQFYLGNWDWPQNNVKGWKPIMEGGKFRFILFDLDGSLNTTDALNTFAWKQYYTFDKLYGEDFERYEGKEIEFVTIFLNMLQNDNFRKQFADSYCLVAGSVFEPSRCEEIIRELANNVNAAQNIYDEVYYKSTSPWNTANSLINGLSSSRQSEMINTLKNFWLMDLSEATSQQLKLSANIGEARLMVNDLPVPTNKFSGQIFPPVTLKSSAPAGFKFLGWKLVESSGVGNELLPMGSTWSFYDQGSLDNASWQNASYDYSSWSSGNAPLGYGKDGVNTSMAGYLPTYYLRTQLNLSKAPATDDTFTLSYVADDGFIIYVNGTEAGRYNMPGGTVSYSTYATTYAHDNPDRGTLTLNASLFRKGTNRIAVELHNNNATSTDILWDASITQTTNETAGEYVSSDEEYTLPQSGNMNLQACYGEMTDREKTEAGINTSPVVINEVSAGNSINVNEYFKKDDWVELYNTTGEDIDLEGMYMTDNKQVPQKYQITAQGTKASTILPAHGYKIIWCSKRQTQTELHANFKLNNEDGCMVRIAANDGSWADSLFYCAHNGDQTVGRYPDGSSDIYLMTTPTIRKSNTLTTYASLWEYEAPADTVDTAIRSTLASRSGGLSIAYTAEALSIKSEETPHVSLTVYNPSGALMLSQAMLLTTAHERVSVSTLPPGIYIARLRDNEGNACATKFIKK